MIASPAFNGQVTIPFAISLAETFALLRENGIDVTFRISHSGSLLVLERNRLMHMFLESDCTHLLCVDVDIGWSARHVMGMIAHDKELVAGVYPNRTNGKFYFRPILKEDQSVVLGDNNLLKMEGIPAGFMLLKREVLEKIKEKLPNDYFNSFDSEEQSTKCYAFFNILLENNNMWGEDYYFCRLCTAAGVDIWVDANIQLWHGGTVGCLAKHMGESPEDPTKKEFVCLQ